MSPILKITLALTIGLAGPSAPAPGAADYLARAAEVLRIRQAAGRVLHYQVVEGVTQDYQSDRTYEPFFSSFTRRELWLDLTTGAERMTGRQTYPGFDGPGPEVLTSESATFVVRDTALIPAPSSHLATVGLRALDPWAVVLDWTHDSAVTVEGHRRFRDYDRVVLGREGRWGRERLLLDPKSGYPVALERTERHYLWGQVQVQYVYSTWIMGDGVSVPGATFRLVDGRTEITRTLATVGLIARDSAPRLALPAGPPMPLDLPLFLQPANPDTIRVGPTAFLLRNRGYTEAVVLARDTVWLFDATQGDERARQDSVWIGKLFPGRHPVVLVVTDLAWPHVAGVRWWVANGATVISHQISRSFLEQVVARRWTAAPDRLERLRPHPVLHFRGVRDSLRVAGGAITLFPIDGIASEGALLAFVHPEKFLWGSDYVQTLAEPSQYGREVYQAVRRNGVRPDRVAAQHLPLTPWDTLAHLVGGMDAAGP